jgi:hypothetical protein
MVNIIKQYITNNIVDDFKYFIPNGIGAYHHIYGTINMINFKYLSYYISEIEKLIKEERKEDLLIHTTDDPEDDNYALYQYVVVNKEFCFCPDEFVDMKFPNPRLETSELLGFLKFIKKELGSSEKILNAKERIHDIYNNRHNLFYFDNKFIKFSIKTPQNSNGVYKMDYQYTDAGGNLIKKANHTMFPDSWDAQKTIDKIQEVYNSPSTIQIPNTNKWTGTTSEGIKITIMKYSDGKIISSYPNLL